MTNRTFSTVVKTLAKALLLSSCCMLLASCSSVAGGNRTVTLHEAGPALIAAGEKVKQVSTSNDTDQLGQAADSLLTQYTVANQLNGLLTAALGANDSVENGVIVDVKIVGVRLRSNGTAIWWGVMAGADKIMVEVTASKDGKELKKFQVAEGTALGGFVYGGRGIRLNRILSSLSSKIAAGI